MKHHSISGASPQASACQIGFTLVELPVVIGIIVLMIAFLLPTIGHTHEQAYRVKCASNLKQIGYAALMYSNNEVRTGAYPRTYFSTGTATLIADSTGGSSKSPTNNSFDTTKIGINNVTASFYLILKTQDITPDVFICPSTQNVRDFGPGVTYGVEDVSNWNDITQNTSYSYNCPFPSAGAIAAGWKFNNTLGSDFVIAADRNPGVGNIMANGNSLKTSVTTISYSSGKRDMDRGNSNNHNNNGQNVLYCDGHVEFQNTAFCGPQRVGWMGRDNIYATDGAGAYSTGPTLKEDLNNANLLDPYDAYLLPGPNSNGK